MLSNQKPLDNSVAVRAAVLDLVAKVLRPALTGQDVAALAAWLGALDTATILRCLPGTPEAVAARLSAALSLDTAARHPADALDEIARAAFPGLTIAQREAVCGFARVVREIAIENDGAVVTGALFARGYGSTDSARLMPYAERILAILDRRAPMPGATDPAAVSQPFDALRAAGRRAAAALDLALAA